MSATTPPGDASSLALVPFLRVARASPGGPVSSEPATWPLEIPEETSCKGALS